ncbi:hypothetical protein [Salmonella phage SS8]|uniref:Uncharacterized protein n=1 Tax=Salmonella phage SS5 TaxID=2592216 RepID=A0A5C0CEE0_9CAUD|nr:hypothetical protein QA018_gp57 [Salmonella phage SS5]QDH44752.1 hypothetical protein [Salmonella phage SF4]QDH44768.1 hypothetical protein [Salmonella phage SF5]QDH44878.1 hypothetical protein [Salmonella phage SS4]QDH44917.1 hypothetical protein [Salmonella phage SS10]QDH44985.1 hypothetical protein [Salmonella phage SI2]QDH45071.1 hypothetical protein [Salmonella phage SF1]QEI23557.1 hypothetical protein [Salmonella phage SI1]QEI24424.1 hypothetical protein [Salmonella phage SS6]QEI2
MAQSQPWRNSLTLLNLRHGTPGEARHTKPKVFIVHNKKSPKVGLPSEINIYTTILVTDNSDLS